MKPLWLNVTLTVRKELFLQAQLFFLRASSGLGQPSSHPPAILSGSGLRSRLADDA